ncbi:DUF3667 domain-containing protein [Polaribacter atrinae]|uniref:DUF3667 domain-containing protein n=1 Tax=Polaribacter atrinae TaxID=1333662 RepID=UPI003C6E0296
MKLATSKKNRIIIKDPACLNCGHPFSGQEKFCPDCGQENKGNRITFYSFIHQLFSGLFSFDTKLWKTLIPLLIKPGEVSKNYIAGKRQCYSNPFQFYLTVSVVFFLIIGITDSYNDFNNFRNGKKSNNTDVFTAIQLDLKEAQEKDATSNFKETDSLLTILKDSISKTPFLKVAGK